MELVTETLVGGMDKLIILSGAPRRFDQKLAGLRLG
jgi:hypothetical protein